MASTIELLATHPARSAASFAGWLAARTPACRDQVQVVVMDGITGYKNAATSKVPDAVTVMDPSTSSPWPGRSSICAANTSNSSSSGAAAAPATRSTASAGVLRTRTELLNPRQQARLDAVVAAEEHAPVEVTHWVYQQIVAACAHPDPRQRKTLLTRVIGRIRAVPAGLEELEFLGRTLHRRRDDVLAYFTHRVSNGPTEAINGRLDALRRTALGFRNLISYPASTGR